MTSVTRFRVELAGWIGGPGLNTIWAINALGDTSQPDAGTVSAFAGTIRDSYFSAAEKLVSGMTVRVLPEASTFDGNTGVLQAVHGFTAPPIVTSSPGAQHPSTLSRATQVLFQLRTKGVVGNRIARGRMFFGPVNVGCIAADGTVPTNVQTELITSFTGLTSGLGMRWAVFSQPNANRPVGVVSEVTSHTVSRVPATLSKRRD